MDILTQQLQAVKDCNYVYQIPVKSELNDASCSLNVLILKADMGFSEREENSWLL